MTVTEEQSPTFKAADRDTHEELSWFRELMRKYTNSFSVARASLFWALLKRQKRTLKWLFIILVVYSAGLLNVANLTRGMVDNGIVLQVSPLWDYVRYIAFWAAWGLVFGFIQQQLAERLTYNIEFDMRVWLYTHIQAADLRRLDTVAAGQLVTRSLTDVELMVTLLRVFPTLTGFVPVLLAVAVIVIIINPIMGVMAILALPINVWLLMRFRRTLRALSWAELNERAEVTRSIDEPVRGIRVVKAFGREALEQSKVADVTERAFRYSLTRTRLLARYDFFLKTTPILVQSGLLGIGAFLLASGRLTEGTFLLAFQLGNGLNRFASAFDNFADAWQYLRGAQDRIAEMLAYSSRPVTDGRMIPLPSSGLELRGIEVVFGNRRFMHGLTVQVRPGELVVVHGPPGSGKSTLAGIASGLIAPDGGVAILDGIPLAELDPPQLRQTVRVVSEEPLLLAASLRDNLLLGAFGEISDETMLEAMRLAGADEVVEELEGGLDGLVGDRGLTVSGGQRQRISLARALVAQPRVLILDDALSAVNPSLEIEIMARVRRYLPGTAILYITRRTSLTELADHSIELRAPETVPTEEFVPPKGNPVLDGSAELDLEAESLAAVAGGTAIDMPGVVDQAAMEAETDAAAWAPPDGAAGDGARAEGEAGGDEAEAPEEDPIGPRSALAGLAAIDPQLARLVASLEVTKEKLDVPDEVAYDESHPRFWRVARPYRGIMMLALVLVLFVALGTSAPSIFFGNVTDFATEGETTKAYTFAATLAVIGMFTGLMSMLFRITAQRFNQSVIATLRRRVFYRLCRLGVNYYDRELPGDVATRVVADLDKILAFGQQPAFQLASFTAIFVVAVSIIAILAPSVMPVVGAVLAVIIILTLIELPIAARALAWAREELGVVTRKFQEDFGARHEIRHLGAHAIQTQKFVEASWERRRARWWGVTVVNVHSSIVQFLGSMMTALVLYRTGTLVLDQRLSIGVALSVQLLASLSTQPLQALAPIYNQFLDVRVSWRRLCEPFDEPILPVEAADARPCPPLTGPVAFENVVFTYPQTERTVLQGVSFTMEPRKVTALVGYTGAGKSSIAKLLSRTYDPDRGRIVVSGHDLRELELDTYRPRLGIVPQDPFVFAGTVASNVRYSDPQATDEEVEQAVRAVGAWDMLSVLPGGLDHRVEEEGRNLTAAQRQLIALARAWLAKPDILVLDEATSLLDTGVEDIIIQAIHDLECTTLMITHRESVAAKSDYIVVLEAGRVVDAGPEEQVARPGGPYDRLWRVQEDELAQERDQVLSAGPGDATSPA